MPEDQKSKTAILASLTDQAAITHTHSNPVDILAWYGDQVVEVHTFNREDYKMRGIIKWEETALRHSLILRFREAASPFRTEVVCF